MKSILILVVALSPLAGVAQERASDRNSTAAPIQTKRKPPQPDILDHYDFAAQVSALQGGRPSPGKPAVDQQPAGSAAPKDFQPKQDIQLTPTAQEAVRVTERWMALNNAPAAGPDGKVLYSYGAGLPTVVCAPLRVCIIELQSGERVIGEPQIGDAVRWNLAPATYGNGDSATSLVVLKPQNAGLDTNLLITTDRRAYYLRLISKPEEYVARVAFAYPDDDQRKWQIHLAQQQRSQQADRLRDAVSGDIASDKIWLGYKVKGGNENLRPVRVFDDGSKTFLQMPPAMKNREAPVLVVIGPADKGEMVNYRVKDQTYIVDRVFNRAELVVGTGKKAEKVEIIREQK